MDASTQANLNDQPTQRTFKRWYEMQPAVNKSIQLLQAFPYEYREVLAYTLIELAKKYGDADEIMRNLNSVSPDKVLALFKAKNKNRDYDQGEVTHEAMNYLFVLPDTERVLVANQVTDFVGHVFEYFSICKATGESPEIGVVQSISIHFVRGNLQNAAEHLIKFYPQRKLPTALELHSIRTHLIKVKAKAFVAEIKTFCEENIPQAPENQYELKGDVPPTRQNSESDSESVPADTMLAENHRGMKIRDKLA